MDAALGPPAKMTDRREDLTPMLRQYVELTERYDDALVLFQSGDFYKGFCEAAEVLARICEVTLTEREDSTGTYAMTGVPIDNAESYIEKLLDAGYRVAIADQVEDPDEVSGVVERAVTRIITPGTLTEDELLGGAENNYVAALAADDGRFGVAVLDVSTGDFYATSTDDRETVRDELGRFSPAEGILGPDVPNLFDGACTVSPVEGTYFATDRAAERVGEYFGTPDRLLATDAEVRACGALLAYAEYARGGEAGRLDYLNHLTRYDPRAYMVLDAVALESLEIFERRSVTGGADLTLVDVIDETASALGRRRLTEWLRRPLIDRDRIEARHAAVDALVSELQTRERLHELLSDVYDLERLISRVSRSRADARDLRSLKDTLDVIPEIKAALDGIDAPLLTDLRDRLDEMDDVRGLIDDAIAADPPTEITEGGIISEGYDDRLDELRATEREGKEWITDLEESERERTGIDSLKVGHNAVHGYYIEVTDANVDRVPEDYQRRQTLKNAERYYTPELKEREDEILRAEGQADDLEYELFVEVRDDVAAESERVQAVADAVANLDVLVGFATVAAERDYCRPSVGGDGIDIEGGRHPVVERTEDAFVPNDTHLDDDACLAVITGPNMSGKSTYMRQVALISILAQVGSFVPAESADLRIVDRVFTRVGASDDIAGGRSTFMVEMSELATILEGATANSLVLLDEVGRGTSTTDGLAIAQAVTEFIHDEVGATTLFATHHHELTEVAADLNGAVNRHFRTEQAGEEVSFPYDIATGPAAASYGVEVAGVAGVPDTVVGRSRELLGDSTPDGREPGQEPDRTATERGSETPEEPDRDDVVAELRSLSVAEMTPIQALNTLADLQRRADRE
ncbi:DNA mismatch repair protein MutS [Halorhabdus utahensis DSM 12940]|uniref:DNA mismatch repair protein MutS n=1 Tax=Halorhabdus utahensis (strain DSM 12940 / JCM 11049 / AX-2) TaxID=519442 RepID=C7NS38_HALUD|nr:DNA mismatch repair protein MutS [Halorhabdus utahensis]ACV10645.1 DNA mismatch repair protein MutS [Halorhabdus utahensis DSM 12940]